MSDYKSMFEQAIKTLAAIDDALGIGGDGCADSDQTLSAIEELRDSAKAVIAWCDSNPPAGDALYCIARLRNAIAATDGDETRRTALEVHGTVFFKDNRQYRSQLRFPVADGAYELVKIENPDTTHPLFHVAGESFEVAPDDAGAMAMPPNA